MGGRQARTEHFNMWLTEEECYLFEEATRALGTNVSAFIRSAALREARLVLAGDAENEAQPRRKPRRSRAKAA